MKRLLKFASMFALAGMLFNVTPAMAQTEESTTTTTREMDDDDDMDWGWIGLLGLAGLLGLRGRKREEHVHTNTTYPNNPNRV